MKRITNLYAQIISIENLRLADIKARRGKLNTYGVQVHDKVREQNIQALHEALLTKSFRTSEYNVFTICNFQVFPIAQNRHDRHGRALDFVGYKFFRKQRLMRRSIKRNFCRAVSRFNKRKRPLTDIQYKQAVAPWLGWAKHSNSKHLLKTIIKKEHHASIL